MELRELTRKERLEWLKETLEKELMGIIEELAECNKKLIGEGMEEKDKETVFNLVTRLNQIMIEQERLDIEYNKIIKELWDRIPTLKNDPNLQPKEKVRVK